MWHYISAAKYLDHFLFLMSMIQSGPECILAFVIGTTVKLVLDLFSKEENGLSIVKRCGKI